MADTAARDPHVAGVLKRPFAQQVAFFRGKLGNLVPTARWTDMQHAAHDRGFMVAGAQSADLLQGLAAAVDKTIAQGGSIQGFRKDFAHLVDKSGWNYHGDFNWRTRTIYRTNMATSYHAGRLAQLREGDFPLWVYKHADGETHPRPIHLSWDGVTLPADDAWWNAHYTPNGWGCNCYVMGARSEAHATRLGGRAGPAPDDGIDPKTGAPVGIDKGWDYMPGHTVSGTVRTMAAKTQQWDYTLAKAYMQGVPEGVRDALAVAYRELPSVVDATRRYAQRILEGRTHLDIPPYQTLGLATSEQVAAIQQAVDVDVAGFDYALDKSSVGHVQRKHGNPATETPRGQVAVTAADYAHLPALLDQPDALVSAGLSDVGRPVLRIDKRIGDKQYTAAWEVRTRRKMLVLQSLSIRKTP